MNLWSFKGDLCCCLLSDSILGYCILICWFNFLDKKAVKELHERKR